jgi:hypothetical protein
LLWFTPDSGGRQSKYTDGSRLHPGGRHNPRHHDLTTSHRARISLRILCCNRTTTAHRARSLSGSVTIPYTPQDPSRCVDQAEHICLVCSSHVAPIPDPSSSPSPLHTFRFTVTCARTAVPFPHTSYTFSLPSFRVDPSRLLSCTFSRETLTAYRTVFHMCMFIHVLILSPVVASKPLRSKVGVHRTRDALNFPKAVVVGSGLCRTPYAHDGGGFFLTCRILLKTEVEDKTNVSRATSSPWAILDSLHKAKLSLRFYQGSMRVIP